MEQSDAELAITAAAAGAAVVRECYGMPSTRYTKSGTHLATEVDIEAERVVTTMIRAARPHDAMHGEESGIEGRRARPAPGWSTRCAAR